MPNPEPAGQPWTDEIVAEVRAVRERLFAECDYDLSKLAQRLREIQNASGRPTVAYPPRRAQEKPVAA